jgi:hypothetical protein
MSDDDERIKLTFEEAIALLPDGEEIHTVMQAGPMLLGADWSRKSVYALIRKHGAELSGPDATANGHGLVVIREGEFVELPGIRMPAAPVFIATRKAETPS